MIVIQPQYLQLNQLLNKRLFRIPEYQRAYSWSSVQRKDLFSDIDKTFAKGSDAGHFMAAAVCLRRDKQTLDTDEYQVLEIVDGQQRITTLIILQKAVELALDRELKVEKKIADEIHTLLVKSESDTLLLLQTNHDSSHHFANYIRHGTVSASKDAKTIADKELLMAIEECTDFVLNWKKKNGDLTSLVSLLKNRLFFLLHEIDDEKMVYTVFEVLNSRGLEVSWLDRLKSILMGAAFELEAGNKQEIIRELHTTWRDIYTCIGLRQGMSTEALRFAATLKMASIPSRVMGEEDSVSGLRNRASNAQRITEVAQWLLKVAKACDTITANSRIHAVTQISQARLLAVALYLRTDITVKERANLIKIWEKITFRIYGMLGHDARYRVGDYARLAWKIVNEKMSTKDISEALKNIGANFPIENAVKALKNENCYEGWQNELRYFMYRYEEYLSKKNKLNFSNEQWEKIWLVSPSESIEHIWPQSKAPEKDVHRLGNLVLLPPKLNSKLQAKSPLEKKEAYQRTGLLIVTDVVDRINNEKKWNKKTIEEREADLLEWAKEEWSD
jgi:hypothetical protein